MSNKKILHLKVPMRGLLKDDISLSPKILGDFLKLVQDRLKEEYIIVASPCDPSVADDDFNFVNFDMKSISKEEIMKLLENKK